MLLKTTVQETVQAASMAKSAYNTGFHTGGGGGGTRISPPQKFENYDVIIASTATILSIIIVL